MAPCSGHWGRCRIKRCRDGAVEDAKVECDRLTNSSHHSSSLTKLVHLSSLQGGPSEAVASAILELIRPCTHRSLPPQGSRLFPCLHL